LTGLLVIFVAVLVSFIVVRIGAIALELTGLDPAAAAFQALSAFTNSGFTTQEAELVVGHPRRRRILQVLMIAGNVGIVTVIAGMVQALQVRETVQILLLELVLLAAVLYLLYRIVVLPRINRWIRRQVEARLEKFEHIEPVSFEELLEQQEHWGVFRVRVHEGMACVGKPLGESRPRDQGIMVLTIERGREVIPAPGPAHLILAGDSIIIYGRLDRVEQMIGRAAKPPARASATE
jgi:Trk K+ transport system NAD-binding subunit